MKTLLYLSALVTMALSIYLFLTGEVGKATYALLVGLTSFVVARGEDDC